MLTVFTLSLFLSAALLFSIQLMFTKMILPVLGGTPAVWNTAMMCFQAMLFLGYAYAHATTRFLSTRGQALLHLSLMVVALVTLPVSASENWLPPTDSNPVFWLVGVLLLSIGLPFFAIAANAPMLQSWFGRTSHPAASNPYFLYSASNLGSVLALLSYPVLIEPLLRLDQQSGAWTGIYALLVGLTAACAILVWRVVGPVAHKIKSMKENSQWVERPEVSSVTMLQRGKWLVLSFVPSSLLLGVTKFLTTDVAAVPLLWVLPLVLYLATFVNVFARNSLISHRVAVRIQPFFLLPLVVFMFWGGFWSAIVMYPLHLLVFFLTALVCHGELAAIRPAKEHLTEFYLWLAVGGLLGGVFNTLLAPLIFASIIEYPLLIILASALRPSLCATAQRRVRWHDFMLPMALGAVLITITKLHGEDFLSRSLWILILVSSLLGMALYSFRERPLRLGLGIGCVMLIGMVSNWGEGTTLVQARNFFGVVAVEQQLNDYRVLRHGTTIHGAQSVDPARSQELLAYYTRTGPIGLAMEAWHDKLLEARVAVGGLGVGTIGCYAQVGQEWTFYEINPAVVRIARDPRYFTYLSQCMTNGQVVLGDARLKLRNAPDGYYDLIILDAFSSDSIPIHLLTREAIAIYVSKLAKGGIVVFNISNRYLNLVPVLASVVKSQGLAGRYRSDPITTEDDRKRFKFPSTWAVMARRDFDLGTIANGSKWLHFPEVSPRLAWTDNFSNILTALILWPNIRVKPENEAGQ